MVITPITFDIKAILAPVVVSLPQDAGKTTVLSPSGIAVLPRATIIISLLAPQSLNRNYRISILVSLTVK